MIRATFMAPPAGAPFLYVEHQRGIKPGALLADLAAAGWRETDTLPPFGARVITRLDGADTSAALAALSHHSIEPVTIELPAPGDAP